MSGTFNPATDGSNSKVPNTLQRASSTPFYTQFGSSSGVLNQSGGLMHTGYSQQKPELNNQSQEFPSLSGNRDGLSYLGLSQLPTNTLQKEQMHANMAYLMQYQQMAQQHRMSSSRVSRNRDLHFHGFEHNQQYQPSISYFANQFMDNPMELPSVPNHFGMQGMLKRIKENPGLTSLAVGTDLTTLGLNLISSKPLHKTFASPWVSEPFKVEPEPEPEYDIPMCYNVRHPPPLKQSDFKKFQPDTLLYIFYSMPKDEAQLFAANELYTRGWFYHKEYLLWFTRVTDMEPLLKTSTYERGSYFVFNSHTWTLRNKDDFVLHYDKIERWPPMPRH